MKWKVWGLKVYSQKAPMHPNILRSVLAFVREGLSFEIHRVHWVYLVLELMSLAL